MLFEYCENIRVKGHGLILRSLLFAIICTCAFQINIKQVYGYTAVKGTVKVKSGKARKEASTKAAFVFGVTSGESVIVVDETTGDDGNLWYKIKVLNSTGYVRSDLIEKSSVEVKSESTIEITDEKKDSPASSDVKNEQANTQNSSNNGGNKENTGTFPTVKGTNVIVREEASTKSGIRTTIQPGQVLTIISSSVSDDGKNWSYVSFSKDSNNFKGYIRSDLIDLNAVDLSAGTKPNENDNNEKNEESSNKKDENENSDVPLDIGTSITNRDVQVGEIKGTSVNLRSKPVDGEIVGRLSQGASITCTGQVYSEKDSHVWFKVSFVYENSPKTGYVRSDFTSGITEYADANNPNGENADKSENKEDDSNKKPNESSESNETIASIKGIGVRIRTEAVNGNIIAQLDTGYPVEVIDEVTGSDNNKWYKIRFSKNDVEKEGYVRSDFVSIVKQNYKTEVSDEEFESQISEFPETYKASLRALHEKYPSWQFVPVNTNLDWNEVVKNETKVGKNLVAKSSVASWKSTAPQAYNWASNEWYGFDGGAWAAASPELIQYYLDPRNFLDDSGIFQFETLGFEDYQNVDGLNNLLSTSFMKNRFTDTDGAERSYADVFYEAGKTYNISPYHLAARAYQEQGALGTSQSISGNVSGLENIFNYFNIGAYAANGRSATINGLYYAAGSDEGDMRPWNSRYKSIMGAAKYISEKYIAVSQNTLYFQKFNVVNDSNGIYSHQYMSNIVAASNESARLRKAYSDLNTRLVFRIPYYSNMPDARCVKPTSDSNPNTYLKSLSVEGYNFTTPFSSVYSTYYLNVSQDVESVNINAEAVSGSSNINGTGTVSLVNGDNKIQIVCKAENGATKIYTIHINRN